ncbi:hypothetical protein G6F22_018244 [Rhizopus arrhizus]|nr:hypothetical protein G6F22_018244 [Rhizopus arrhizus]
MGGLHAGSLLEQLAGQMRRRAVAGRPVVKRIGLLARVLDKRFKRIDTQRGPDEQEQLAVGQQGDRPQVPLRIERHAGEHQRVDRFGGRWIEQEGCRPRRPDSPRSPSALRPRPNAAVPCAPARRPARQGPAPRPVAPAWRARLETAFAHGCPSPSPSAPASSWPGNVYAAACDSPYGAPPRDLRTVRQVPHPGEPP